MSQNGWEKWWWHDWLTDPELQAATPATRGIWVNLLGHMWVKSDHKLTLPIGRFCRLAGCSETEFLAFLDECDELSFCDMSRENNARITLVSRRRHRQDKARENNRLRQQEYRRNAKVTHTEAEAEAEAEAERKKKPPSGVKKKASADATAERGSRLPDDWQPDPTETQWASQEFPAVDHHRETDKFRDYWLSVPGQRGRKTSWPRTWRNWIRKAAESTKPNGSDYDRPIRGSADWYAERARQRLERAEAAEVLGGDGGPLWPKVEN